MVDLVALILLVGASTLGFAVLFRALPWPSRWLYSPRPFLQKLFHCAGCAAARAAIVATALWIQNGALPWWQILGVYLAATGLATYGFSQIFPPPIELPGSDA